MPAIDPTSQLASLIRGQVAALRRERAKGAPGKSAPAAAGASPTDSAPDLASVVAQRIRSISPDDPQRERKAMRMFLEAVLLAELGQNLVADPAFAVMVDHVQQQMESDPGLAKASTDAARLLLKSADSAA